MPDEAAPGVGRAAIAARLGVPLLLLVLIVLEIRAGVASLPLWMEGLGGRLGWSDEALVRAVVGVQVALGLATLLVARWSRPLAVSTLTLLGFAAIAELSALLGRDEEAWRFAAPAAVLAVVGAALPALLRAAPPRVSAGGSAAWRTLGLLAIATGAFAVAARIPVAPLPAEELPSFSGEVVELGPETWTGQTIPATGLASHVPALTALTLEGRTAVVLYNPRCGSCHDLFDEWFAEGAPFRVVAVKVPPEAGALLLESDLPADVACPGCERVELRTGPLWLIQPPVVAAVEDGVVTCVAMRPEEVESCLGPWFGRTSNAPEAASREDGATGAPR
jgi:hypothetical protein